jgi:hypothetical protein
VHWRNGAYTHEGVFALGELSLSVLNHDYGNMLEATTAFTIQLASCNLDDCKHEVVSDYLDRLKTLKAKYERLFEPSLRQTPGRLRILH